MLRRLLLGCSFIVPIVVIVVRLQNLFTKFLLSLMDIRVKLVAVFSDRKLLVVVDRNHYLPRAKRLIIRVVELSDIGVAQRLLGR